MKKFLLSLSFFTAFAFININAFSQFGCNSCPNTFPFSGITINTQPGVNTTTPQITMGQYMLVKVYQGHNYTFSMCGLASPSSFDSEMNIYRDVSGTFITFDDDFCGGGCGTASLSQVTFTAPATEFVRVVLTQYPCGTSTNKSAVSIIDNTCGMTLVTNGDFEAGNTGFTTAYTLNNSGLIDAAEYEVTVNPNHFCFFGPDHTLTGPGNAMYVNGSGTPNTTVWQETISVTPNTNYYFSTWVNGQCGNSNPAILQFSINGVQIGSNFSPSQPLVWEQFFTPWNSGSNTTATIRIVNQNTFTGGNDFGLDDIVFTTIAPVQIASAGTTNASCANAADGSITLTATGGVGPYEYSIDNGTTYVTGSNPYTFTGVAPGTYNVKVKDNCSKESNAQPVTVGFTDATPPVLQNVPADATYECDAVPGPANVTATDNCDGAVATTYYTTPTIKTKLLRYWKGDGNYNDAVGSATGTPTGAVSFGPGIIGSNSFSFNGSTGYISTGTAGSVSGTGNFSVSAWVKTSSNSPMVVIQQRDAGFVGEYMLKVGGNHNNTVLAPGKVYFLAYSGGPVVDLFSSGTVNDGKWHQIVAERNGTNIRIYIDGVLNASGSTVVPVNFSSTIGTTIGRDVRDNNSNFNGLIDEVKVWSASTCPSSYEFDRVWTATDASGNQAAAVQHITVQDTKAPTLTCPADITVNNASGQCGAPVSYAASATDNCNTATIKYSIAPGSFFAIGTTTVTTTATDECGNSSTCSFTVTVVDNEAPVITCPANITVANDAGKCGATVSISPATATDNCPGESVAGVRSDALPLTADYPVGTTTIQWTATDAHGNSSTCSQTVTVNDTEKPQANCKPATITLVNGAATITTADINNNSTDNCGIASIQVSQTNFTCSNIGPNTVTLTVTDVHNNVSTCTAEVTVVGEIPTCSIASIPSDNTYTGGVPTNLYIGYGPQSTTLQVTAPASGAPYTYSWTGGTLSNYNTANPVFTATAAGSYSFTVEVTNKYGCKTTCSITICVTDIRDMDKKNNGKVFICHVPPGNPANAHTLSISVNAVPAHLSNHSGDRLGKCDQLPCTAATAHYVSNSKGILEADEHLHPAFEVTVSPNPSAYQFSIKVQSSSAAPVSLRIFNDLGQIVEGVSNAKANSNITMGAALRSGTYTLEVIQGDNRKMQRILKLK